MFVKDPGAHFTYNLGVGTMRVALLFFIIAAAVTVAFFAIDGVKLIYIGEVKAAVTELSEVECVIDPQSKELIPVEEFVKIPEYENMSDYERSKYTTYKHYVTFEGNMPNGTPFEVTQRTSWTMYSNTYLMRYKQPASRYKLFKVMGSDELFVTTRDKTTYRALAEYCGCNGVTSSPVPIWGIILPFIISIVLFLIGRREINLAMKYPRSDVPEELAGAPAVMNGAEASFAGAENASANETPAEVQNALPDKGETQ